MYECEKQLYLKMGKEVKIWAFFLKKHWDTDIKKTFYN